MWVCLVISDTCVWFKKDSETKARLWGGNGLDPRKLGDDNIKRKWLCTPHLWLYIQCFVILSGLFIYVHSDDHSWQIWGVPSLWWSGDLALPSSGICWVSKWAVIINGKQTAYAWPIATDHLLITAKFSFDFLGGWTLHIHTQLALDHLAVGLSHLCKLQGGFYVLK